MARRHLKRSRYAGVALLTGMVALTAWFAPRVQAQQSSTSARGADSARPDLSGMWDGPVPGGAARRFTQYEPPDQNEDGNLTRLFPSRRCAPNQLGCRDNTNQSNDGELTGRINANRPVYRPEHWDKVQFLDYDTNFSDPMFKCLPLGLPRIGPPRKIIQSAHEVALFYGAPIQTSSSFHYRVVPLDGRKHNPDAFPTFYGDSIGYWEGDTLVVESVSFNDTTWLGAQGGYFHSFDLRVVERFTRSGDVLQYEVTVDDPAVLLQPWVLAPRQLGRNTNPNAAISEGLPCQEYDSEITVSRIRH